MIRRFYVFKKGNQGQSYQSKKNHVALSNCVRGMRDPSFQVYREIKFKNNINPCSCRFLSLRKKKFSLVNVSMISIMILQILNWKKNLGGNAVARRSLFVARKNQERRIFFSSLTPDTQRDLIYEWPLWLEFVYYAATDVVYATLQ